MRRWHNSKKAVIMHALASGKPVCVREIAKQLYEDDSLYGESRVVHLISAYRAKDPFFQNVRIRNKYICFVSTENKPNTSTNRHKTDKLSSDTRD
jgi:hypothetical protein